MLTLEWLVAIIGGFIQAPLDHPLLRMMRRGSEIAVKIPASALYQHGLWSDRACAASSSSLMRDWQVSLFGNSNLQGRPGSHKCTHLLRSKLS